MKKCEACIDVSVSDLDNPTGKLNTSRTADATMDPNPPSGNASKRKNQDLSGTPVSKVSPLNPGVSLIFFIFCLFYLLSWQSLIT